MKPNRLCMAALLFLGAMDFNAGDAGDCPGDTVKRRDREGSGWTTACLGENGVRHGPFRHVSSEGVVLVLGQYERGLRVGRWERWHSNGTLHEDGSYAEERRTGWWTRWHPNGQKAEEGEYRVGDEVGVWRVWNEQGTLISEVPRDVVCPPGSSWLDVPPSVDGFSPLGGVSGGYCRRPDGVPQGPTVAWDAERRKLAMVGSYCDGHARGRWSYFWRNGVLAREGSYVGPSHKHGTWTDFDKSGRKVVEIEYSQGREIARREYPSSLVELPLDPQVLDRVAVQRFEAAARESCNAGPRPLRPYRGLREELRAADAVVVMRVVDVESDRPPGWAMGMPPPDQRIDAIVKRVLAGSLGVSDTSIRLWLATAEHRRRFETLPRAENEFRPSVEKGSDVTALVKRNGERWEIANLLAADQATRTDAFLAEYARLAALDERAFAVGLTPLIADLVRSAPERLLWGGWGPLAMDDWSRLTLPSLADDPSIEKPVSEALATLLVQIDAHAEGHRDGWLNLRRLPWLIRLLATPQRRTLALALLRLHPIFLSDLEAAEKAAEEARKVRPGAENPETEMPAWAFTLAATHAMMAQLMECLALCVDPTTPPRAHDGDTVDRAREFVRSASGDA